MCYWRRYKIPPFRELFWKIKVLQNKEMMGIQSRIPRVKKAEHVLPVLPLIPYKNSSVEEEKGRYIAFELKTRVRQLSDATWMNRKTFKLVELTTRQMAASVNHLNNALPVFPNPTEASKFLETELIGLLQLSLPVTWRVKFDLDGYIPTLHSKTKLIEAYEAIEQSEISLEKPSKEESSQNHKMVKRAASRIGAPPAKKQKSVSEHYCTEHGQNPTHSTADCWTIKNRAKPQLPIQKEKKSFLNLNLRNEINLLSKQSSKKKVLEMYASVIRREQAKLEEEKPQKRKKIIALESESNNKTSVQIISAPKKKMLKKLRKWSSDNTDVLAEEQEYQKKLKWLKDHEDLTGEEENNPGDESSGDEASSTWHKAVESITINSNSYEYFASTSTILRPSKNLE